MAEDDLRAGPARPARTAVPGRVPTRALVPAVAAGLLALFFLVLAFVLGEPSRHARGLLVAVDLVGVIGVGAVWLRVIRLLSLSVHRGPVE